MLAATAYHAFVAAAPSASDSFARRSLVDEIHREREQAVVEQRQGRRRTVRNRVLLVVALVVAALFVGYFGKRFFDTRRVERGLEAATPEIERSSAATLETALSVLESNLDIDPSHGPTLGRIAVVRTHQYVRGLVSREVVIAAVERAKDAGRPEGLLCEGMLAALAGDFDQARRAHEASEDSEDPIVAADAAWLQGVAALGHPYDVALETEAVKKLESALEVTPAWVPNLRVLASLHARRGTLDDALELTARARALAPGDVGLSIDEALFSALKAEELDGVLAVTEQLSDNDDVAGSDRSRLWVAEGLALLHQGELESGLQALESAWGAMQAWDNDGRMHVIEGLLAYGRLGRVESLRKELYLGSQADALFDAWFDLARGESQAALKRLEQLPQEMPRVAHLQALALTEEYRYEEALRWVEFARKRLPGRPDLEVAAARVATAMGNDAAAALEQLELLGKEHPWTYRVWTGLAQARLAVPEPDEAQTERALEALNRALEREFAPAEAAYLLAQHHAPRSFDDPAASGIALANFRRAAQTAPRSGLHRAAYGAYLGRLARAREAKAVLLELVDDERLGPEPLIELARVVTTDAKLRGTPVDEDVAGWLTTATQRGGDPWRIELEWARFELARRNPRALDRGRVRVEKVLEHDPRNVDARALHGTILLALGESRAAKATLREGIRRTLRVVDGRLYVVLARTELAAGQKRRAASIAYKGWRKMVREPLPVGALLETAPFVAGLWTDLGQPKAAGTVGRGLTFRAPVSPRAWVLRGEIQLADDDAEAACSSADKAIELDARLPSGWGLRAECSMAQRKYDDAVSAWERAVELAEGTVAQAGFRTRLTAARRRAKR